MAISQLTRWDDSGTLPGAGNAKYVAGDQPISEYDNWFNWSAAKDVENLIAALENVATGHDHDGINSKKVDGSDVVNTPAGNIAATDVQAAIDELDTEKESTSTSHASRHVTGGGDVIANAIAAGNAGLMTGADKTKLNGIDTGAKDDQTGAEIKAAYEGEADTNAYNDAAVTKLAGIEAGADNIPTGLISMWHGLIANIPVGYVLCDGTNSTPDLREKFLRGAPAATEAGGTGGADTHTLTTNEMPAHAHNTHSGGVSTGYIDNPQVANTEPTSVPTGTTGGGAAHNNMPAYYQILYIMKT